LCPDLPAQDRRTLLQGAMSMIRILGRASSSNVQALMWCVGELGLEYEREDVGLMYGGNDTAEFLAMNPNGTVPVLMDGDAPAIWETGAILRYLSSKYGSDTFWPADYCARAKVDKWAEWAKLNIAGRFTVPVFWRVVRTAPSQRNQQAIDDGLAALGKFLAVAEQQLAQNEYLVSSDFSLADIQLGHVLYRYFDIDIDRADFPCIRKYSERLAERAEYRKHVMISYDELRVEDGDQG
jgi:glutathione S-transferase